MSLIIVLSGISEIVGGSFCAFTASTNESDAVPPSASVTVTVIVVVPNWFSAGVTATVRSVPLPPNRMFPLGTNAVFEELASTSKELAPVSKSLILKRIPTTGTSSFVV